jgi:hypothetical protein
MRMYRECIVFEETFYEPQRVSCFLCGLFAGSFVFDLGFFVFGLEGYFWVESYE